MSLHSIPTEPWRTSICITSNGVRLAYIIDLSVVILDENLNTIQTITSNYKIICITWDRSTYTLAIAVVDPINNYTIHLFNLYNSKLSSFKNTSSDFNINLTNGELIWKSMFTISFFPLVMEFYKSILYISGTSIICSYKIVNGVKIENPDSNNIISIDNDEELLKTGPLWLVSGFKYPLRILSISGNYIAAIDYHIPVINDKKLLSNNKKFNKLPSLCPTTDSIVSIFRTDMYLPPYLLHHSSSVVYISWSPLLDNDNKKNSLLTLDINGVVRIWREGDDKYQSTSVGLYSSSVAPYYFGYSRLSDENKLWINDLLNKNIMIEQNILDEKEKLELKERKEQEKRNLMNSFTSNNKKYIKSPSSSKFIKDIEILEEDQTSLQKFAGTSWWLMSEFTSESSFGEHCSSLFGVKFIAAGWLDSIENSRIITNQSKCWLFTLDNKGTIRLWMLQNVYHEPRMSITTTEFLSLPSACSLPPFIMESPISSFSRALSACEFYIPFSYSQSLQSYNIPDSYETILGRYNLLSQNNYGSIIDDPTGQATPFSMKLYFFGSYQFSSIQYYEMRFSHRSSLLLASHGFAPKALSNLPNLYKELSYYLSDIGFSKVVVHPNFNLPLIATLCNNGSLVVWTYKTQHHAKAPIGLNSVDLKNLHFLQLLSPSTSSSCYEFIAWSSSQPWLFCVKKDNREEIIDPGTSINDVDVFNPMPQRTSISISVPFSNNSDAILVDVFTMGAQSYVSNVSSIETSAPTQFASSLSSPSDPFISCLWMKIASFPFGPNSPWDISVNNEKYEYLGDLTDFFVLDWNYSHCPSNDIIDSNSSDFKIALSKRNSALQIVEKDGCNMLLVTCRINGIKTYSINTASLLPQLYHKISLPLQSCDKNDLPIEFSWLPSKQFITSAAIYRLPIFFTEETSSYQLWVSTLDGNLHMYQVINEEVTYISKLPAAMGGCLSSFNKQYSLFHTGSPPNDCLNIPNSDIQLNFPVYSGRFVSDIKIETMSRVRVTLSPLSNLKSSLKSSMSNGTSINVLETSLKNVSPFSAYKRSFSPSNCEICIWECVTSGTYFDYSLETSIPIESSICDDTTVSCSSFIIADDNIRLVTAFKMHSTNKSEVNRLMLYAPRLHVNRSSWRARDISNLIEDSILNNILSVNFLPSGDLLIMTSNKLHLLKQSAIFTTRCKTDILPIPFYHPNELTQSLLNGHLSRVKIIFKYLITITESVSNDTDITFIPPIPLNVLFDPIAGAALGEYDPEEDTSKLTTILERRKLPYLTARNHLRLMAVIYAVQHVLINRRDVDESGMRFLLQFRLFNYLRFVNVLPLACPLSSSDMLWAFHSDMQESIVNICLPSGVQNKVSKADDQIKLGNVNGTRDDLNIGESNYKERLNSNEALEWKHISSIGLALWLKNITELKKQCEKLAKNQFTKNRDARDCLLLYLALGRKNVVLGLFKLGADPESKKIFTFLSRDFSLEENRVAALKNAYVLAGQKKYEMSMSFFLLANAYQDAILICTRNLGDLQLAILLSRLLSGEDMAFFKKTLESEVLPEARRNGDRYTQHMVLWHLDKREDAVMVLIDPENMRSSIAPIVCSLLHCFESHPVLSRFFIISKYQKAKLFYRTISAYMRSGSPLRALEILQMLKNNISTQGENFKLVTRQQINHSLMESTASIALVCNRQAVQIDEIYLTREFNCSSGWFTDISFLRHFFNFDFLAMSNLHDQSVIYNLIQTAFVYTAQQSLFLSNLTLHSIASYYVLHGDDFVRIHNHRHDKEKYINDQFSDLVKYQIVGSNFSFWLKILNSHLANLTKYISQFVIASPTIGDSPFSCTNSFNKISSEFRDYILTSFRLINDLRMALVSIGETCEDKLLLALELANSPLCSAFLQTCMFILALSSGEWLLLESLLKGSAAISQAMVSSSILLNPSKTKDRYQQLLTLALSTTVSVFNMLRVIESNRNEEDNVHFCTKNPSSDISEILLAFVENLVLYLCIQRWVLDFKTSYIVEQGDTPSLYPALHHLHFTLINMMESLGKQLFDGFKLTLANLLAETKSDPSVHNIRLIINIFSNPTIAASSANVNSKLPAYSSVNFVLDYTGSKRIFKMLEDDIIKLITHVYENPINSIYYDAIDVFKSNEPTLSVVIDNSEGKYFAVATTSGIRESNIEAALTFRKRKIDVNKTENRKLIDLDMNEWEGCLHQFDQLNQNAMWQNLSDDSEQQTLHSGVLTISPMSSSLDDIEGSVSDSVIPAHLSSFSANWVTQLSFLESHAFGVPLSRLFLIIMRPPINSGRRCQPNIQSILTYQSTLYKGLCNNRRLKSYERNIHCIHMASHPFLPFYVSAYADGTLLLWHFNLPHPIREFQNQSSTLKKILKIKFYENRLLVTGSNGWFVIFLIRSDMPDLLAPMESVKAYTHHCNDIAYLGSGNKLITIGDSSTKKNLFIWESLPSGSIELTFGFEVFPETDGGLTALCVLPCHKRVVVGTSSGDLCVVDIINKKIGSTQRDCHANHITHILFDSEREILVSADNGGTVKIWKLINYILRLHLNIEDLYSKQRFFTLPSKFGILDSIGLTDMKLTSNGHLLFTGSDGTVKYMRLKA